MVTNLRDAKSRFSELVKLVAEGEEILITVRGEPLAKLTGVSGVGVRSEDRASCILELNEAAAREAVRPLLRSLCVNRTSQKLAIQGVRKEWSGLHD